MNTLTTFKKSAYLMLMSFFISIVSFAQDKKVDIDINTKSQDSGFWTQPWVWVVAGAVFILLLVALLRGGKRD
ncbi:MAG: hypothetical protein EOO13_16780 [Chitinophagaceae bacterium]|nr:MAG: hypothetical protein EOO13_16780 [Chitinophagaceae bacterium]